MLQLTLEARAAGILMRTVSADPATAPYSLMRRALDTVSAGMDEAPVETLE